MGWDPGVSAVVRGGCATGLAIRVLGRWNRACNRRKGDRNRSGIGQVTDPPPAIPKKWAFFRRPLANALRHRTGREDPPLIRRRAFAVTIAPATRKTRAR